jgi:hypothetical protein
MALLVRVACPGERFSGSVLQIYGAGDFLQYYTEIAFYASPDASISLARRTPAQAPGRPDADVAREHV